MFVLRDTAGRHHLVDEGRDARFGIVRAVQPDGWRGEVCWRDLGLQFRIESSPAVDAPTGRQVVEYRSVSRHGWTDAETQRGGLEPPSSSEIATLRLLTAEAVLVHHHRRTAGAWHPADAVAVDDDGRRWCVGDFGYRTGADIHDGARLVAPEVYVDALGRFLRPATLRARASLARAGNPVYTEVHDPAHDRLLRIRSIGTRHRLEIVGNGFDVWSDIGFADADVVGRWVRGFADGRYSLGRRWSPYFVPDGGAPVRLYGFG